MSITTTDPPRPRQPRFVLHIGSGDDFWKYENRFDQVYDTLTDGNSAERPLKLKYRRWSALWLTVSSGDPLPDSQDLRWLKEPGSAEIQPFGNGRYWLEFDTRGIVAVIQRLEALDEKAQGNRIDEEKWPLESKFKDKFELIESRLPPGLWKFNVLLSPYLTYRVTESSSPLPMTILSDLEFWLRVEEDEENVEESPKGKGKEPAREPAYHTGDASGALKGH